MANTSHTQPAPQRISRKTPTRPRDASRAQSAVAKQHDGVVPKGSYVGKLQRAAALNAK